MSNKKEHLEEEIDGYTENWSGTTTYTLADGTKYSEEEYAEILRKQYMANPPAGYTAKEISTMSPNDILDMDYFLNE